MFGSASSFAVNWLVVEDHRHGLRMDRFNDRVRRRLERLPQAAISMSLSGWDGRRNALPKGNVYVII